jgi:hypothetical protein
VLSHFTCGRFDCLFVRHGSGMLTCLCRGEETSRIQTTFSIGWFGVSTIAACFLEARSDGNLPVTVQNGLLTSAVALSDLILFVIFHSPTHSTLFVEYEAYFYPTESHLAVSFLIPKLVSLLSLKYVNIHHDTINSIPTRSCPPSTLAERSRTQIAGPCRLPGRRPMLTYQ